MQTEVLDPPPPDLEALLAERARLGIDMFDEVWDGVVHMNPVPALAHGKVESQLILIFGPLARAAGLELSGQFNVGESRQDFRVPDGGLHRPGADGVWIPTAALVFEIVSPGDESWIKLPFYAERGVDEVLIVDPAKRTVDWLGRAGDGYEPIERSGLIELDPAELAARIDWP